MSEGGLVVRVRRRFWALPRRRHLFWSMPITGSDMIRQVVRGFINVLLKRMFILADDIICRAAWNGVYSNSAKEIGAAVSSRHLSILSLRLFLRDVIILRSDVMTLVQFRCSDCSINSNCTFNAIFECRGVCSCSLVISYEPDTGDIKLLYGATATLLFSDARTARRWFFT